MLGDDQDEVGLSAPLVKERGLRKDGLLLTMTLFLRQADGRKVLRSTIREFLCSEAMFHLGIPTTRAASCVTSDSTVIRDIYYDGNPKNEKCTVVLRVAPTFLR